MSFVFPAQPHFSELAQHSGEQITYWKLVLLRLPSLCGLLFAEWNSHSISFAF
jgi:hypothetical protein